MNLALFDFDGTITDVDTFTGFLKYSGSKRRLVVGNTLLALPLLGYRLGWVKGTTLRARASQMAFTRRQDAAVREQGSRYAREVIPTLLRPNALERLQWHRDRGDRIVVVSASLDVYLTPWCDERGYDLLCTRLETRNGRLTGQYAGPDCAGDEKARRVRAAYPLGQFETVYAYGDSHEDTALLELAHERYFRWQRVVA
jgi:HAD superfamily hydrolase (TIGR01490 family)